MTKPEHYKRSWCRSIRRFVPVNKSTRRRKGRNRTIPAPAISEIGSPSAVARPRFWASRVASFPLLPGSVSGSSPFCRKRGTRKSRLETKTENEARSALLARLWCHLFLQNPTNRAENLVGLCSATIGRTEWRMAQSGAIRSRLETSKHRPEPASCPIRGVFRLFRQDRFARAVSPRKYMESIDRSFLEITDLDNFASRSARLGRASRAVRRASQSRQDSGSAGRPCRSPPARLD